MAYRRNGGYSDPLDSLSDFMSWRPSTVLRDLTLMMEDRRFFHPLGALAPAGAIRREDRMLVVPDAPGYRMPHRVHFFNPERVARCVRRKVRREVIFAKGKSGGGSRRPPRRNIHSDIGC